MLGLIEVIGLGGGGCKSRTGKRNASFPRIDWQHRRALVRIGGNSKRMEHKSCI